MTPPPPSDYKAICEDHRRRYGTDIAEFGPRLFEEQYADPRHFLLELLQNAEDALHRRAVLARAEEIPVDERGVRFDLSPDALRVSHFGDPFNPEDVKSICGIGKSTKGLDDIGRFGLGFKSVYAFTDRPEIHSGPEEFAIESYVWPKAADPVERKECETVIVIPRKESADWSTLRDGLSTMLTPSNLLFLRYIESVRWSAWDGEDAEYLRESKRIASGVHHVTILGGSGRDTSSCDEEWLIHSREVDRDSRAVGRVEIAFLLDSAASGDATRFPIRRLTRSALYAYFPTDKETHLGFRVQGPYNTTPARDNVKDPELNEWNRYLIAETASLLRFSLAWLRDRGHISIGLLNCLPLDEDNFRETMFWPLFEKTRLALRDDSLLPADSGTYLPASSARLGRGRDLRSLFTPDELGELCQTTGPAHWLRGEITTDRAPKLRRYLQQQLGIEEFDPESVVNRLTEQFLARRSDAWILRLYEFLADQSGSALRRSLRTKPVLRLDDGSHVRPPEGDEEDVFFPGEARIGFRTVRESVSRGSKARTLLEDLGVREADLVADIVQNVLSNYTDGGPSASVSEYAQHLERIQKAYRTDSREARDRLIDALKKTRWVRAVDSSGKEAGWRFPEELYFPLPVLRELFEGLEGVMYPSPDAFDDAWMGVRGFLDEVGVAKVLRPIKTKLDGKRLWEIGSELRAGAPVSYHGGHDWEIAELRAVLDQIREDALDVRMKRSRRLWDALRDSWAGHRGVLSSCWRGKYHWSYSHSHRSKDFDAAFVEVLRDAAWVVDSDGALHRPNEVVFSMLGWTDEPALRRNLGFLSDEDKRHREQEQMLTMLEEFGITTPNELESWRYAHIGGSTPELHPTEGLADVLEWWDRVKAEERLRYHKEAYPSVLNVSSLGQEDRVSWFTLFALACFRSYGRTTEAQHRGFVDRAVQDGWWAELAESRPPDDTRVWLGRLQAWSRADQSGQDEEFGMWRSSLVALYSVARWLDEYVRLMQNLPKIVQDSSGRVSLRDILNPTYSPSVQKLGVDAAPLARTVGMGVNWMIRELIRGGIYVRGGPMAPYAWMSSRRVRTFLERLGLSDLPGNADDSRRIYEFVVEEIGEEAAEFDGDYDLPLQLWNVRGRT